MTMSDAMTDARLEEIRDALTRIRTIGARTYGSDLADELLAEVDRLQVPSLPAVNQEYDPAAPAVEMEIAKVWTDLPESERPRGMSTLPITEQDGLPEG